MKKYPLKITFSSFWTMLNQLKFERNTVNWRKENFWHVSSQKWIQSISIAPWWQVLSPSSSINQRNPSMNFCKGWSFVIHLISSVWISDATEMVLKCDDWQLSWAHMRVGLCLGGNLRPRVCYPAADEQTGAPNDVSSIRKQRSYREECRFISVQRKEAATPHPSFYIPTDGL